MHKSALQYDGSFTLRNREEDHRIPGWRFGEFAKHLIPIGNKTNCSTALQCNVIFLLGNPR